MFVVVAGLDGVFGFVALNPLQRVVAGIAVVFLLVVAYFTLHSGGLPALSLPSLPDVGLGQAPSPTPASTPDPNLARAQNLELFIHQSINYQRRQYGLPELKLDEGLRTIARMHSKDMLARGYVGSQDPDGHGLQWRLEQAGYPCSVLFQNKRYPGAENTRRTDLTSDDQIAADVLSAWMGSAANRSNVLGPQWQKQGIGVAIGKDGKVLVTQDFC